MRKSTSTVVLLLLALMGGSSLGFAQDSQQTSDDTIATMLRSGWKIVQDGVLQRDQEPSQTETFVLGAAGFTWKLQDLRNQLRRLRLAYQADPTPELRRAILNHRKEIANTQRMIAVAQAAEDKGQAVTDKASCNLNFGYSATAAPLTAQQGVTATASANFGTNCSFSGEVYAYSYSTATVNGGPITKTMTDGPRSGANVTASVNTSQTGAPYCESYSYSSMTSNNLNPSSYSFAASNTSCPAVADPKVTISGPSYINLTSCNTYTWTSTVSGGTSPYTYQWTWGSDVTGTESSGSIRICPISLHMSITRLLTLTVTDSNNHTGSASMSVTVNF